MVLSDWDQEVGEWKIDSADKVEGNAAVYVIAPYPANQPRLSRGSFTELQADFWMKVIGTSLAGVGHNSYGTIWCTDYTPYLWQRWRISLWYDSGSNIKWSRLEKMVNGVWTKIGADTNRGSGAPEAKAFKLLAAYHAGMKTLFDRTVVREVV